MVEVFLGEMVDILCVVFFLDVNGVVVVFVYVYV